MNSFNQMHKISDQLFIPHYLVGKKTNKQKTNKKETRITRHLKQSLDVENRDQNQINKQLF